MRFVDDLFAIMSKLAWFWLVVDKIAHYWNELAASVVIDQYNIRSAAETASLTHQSLESLVIALWWFWIFTDFDTEQI